MEPQTVKLECEAFAKVYTPDVIDNPIRLEY
jgi:hypothetical protein